MAAYSFWMDDYLHRLVEPKDYFKGVGSDPIPTPTNVLLFLRSSTEDLQQRAIQNRSHHRFVLALNLETSGCVHVDNLVLSLKPNQGMLIMPY